MQGRTFGNKDGAKNARPGLRDNGDISVSACVGSALT